MKNSIKEKKMKKIYRLVFLSGLSERYYCDLFLEDLRECMRIDKIVVFRRHAENCNVIVNMAHVMLIEEITEI